MPQATPTEDRSSAFALERLQTLIVVAVALVAVCTALAVAGAPA